MLVGLPRSGKSTIARTLREEKGYPTVNPDSIRIALHGQFFYKDAEPFVWAIAKTMVRSLFIAGHGIVVLDATNTTKERRKYWEDEDWEIHYYVVTTRKSICIDRAKILNRLDLIPVIEKMYKEYEGFKGKSKHWLFGCVDVYYNKEKINA